MKTFSNLSNSPYNLKDSAFIIENGRDIAVTIAEGYYDKDGSFESLDGRSGWVYLIVYPGSNYYDAKLDQTYATQFDLTPVNYNRGDSAFITENGEEIPVTISEGYYDKDGSFEGLDGRSGWVYLIVYPGSNYYDAKLDQTYATQFDLTPANQ